MHERQRGRQFFWKIPGKIFFLFALLLIMMYNKIGICTYIFCFVFVLGPFIDCIFMQGLQLCEQEMRRCN